MCDYLVFIVVFHVFDRLMYIIFDVMFSEQKALGLPPPCSIFGNKRPSRDFLEEVCQHRF